MKSTRKIIAASAAHYEKLGGVRPSAIEDLEELGAPLPKRAKSGVIDDSKVGNILDKLNTVENLIIK